MALPSKPIERIFVSREVKQILTAGLIALHPQKCDARQIVAQLKVLIEKHKLP